MWKLDTTFEAVCEYRGLPAIILYRVLVLWFCILLGILWLLRRQDVVTYSGRL